jgi:pSer/pThr/pTyr-binding forkhead associated (FHA) protein
MERIMFYGRVDVYWPDGPVESYRLNKATIAVGRSTGNDIVLDTTAISRYHITFTFKDQQVLLEDLDSVNGTYVDGVRLQPHAPYVVRGGEEVQIGEVRLIFHPPLEEATTLAEDDTTQRVVLSQPTYRLELDGPDIAVAPGAHVKATLKIENLGDGVDHYIIEVDGLPKGWARTDTNELTLEPGTQGQVLISLKPLRRSESQPGEHKFIVRARSKSKPSEVIDAPAILHVLPYSGFGMALGEDRIIDDAKFQLYLHNQGNAPLLLTVRGTDLAQMLRFQLPQNQLQLEPGERQTIMGGVQLRRRYWFGAEREHEFALLARAHDPSNFLATIPGMYVERGLMPSWVPVLVAPLVVLSVLLVVAAIVWLLGGDDEAPSVSPTINSFTVSNSVIALGSSVNAAWEVVDTDRVELVRSKGDAQQRYEIAPDVPFYEITFDQTGWYTLTLIASNGDLATTAALEIEVRPSIILDLHVEDGIELVRYVQQDVTATWQVQGAKTFDNGYKLWLERADVLAPILPAPLPLTGQQTIPVVITGDQPEWTVTLYAEGQDGVVASIAQKIPVVYPSCELNAEHTVVRKGPGEAYEAIVPPLESSPDGNLSFSPIARDPSGEWLQVSVGLDNARIGWVPRVDFNCTNFDPARLVQTSDYPALPAPTETGPVPMLTPTVMPTADN